VSRSGFCCFHHSRLITQWSSTPSTVYSLPRHTNLVGLPPETPTSTGSAYVLLTDCLLPVAPFATPGKAGSHYYIEYRFEASSQGAPGQLTVQAAGPGGGCAAAVPQAGSPARRPWQAMA
jgi:hypothetical protein